MTDDSQVVLLAGAKTYGTPGATIVIAEVSGLADQEFATHVNDLTGALYDLTQDLSDVAVVMA